MPETTVLRQTRDFAASRPSRPAGASLGRSCQRRTDPHRRAFTLIELLVVIAIISLLVSILLPSLNRAKELARIAACQSNLHSIGLGVQVYAGEFDGFLPPHSVNPYYSQLDADVPGLPWRTYAAYWSNWADSFNLAILEEKNYISDPKVFYCPSQMESGVAWGDKAAEGEPSFQEIWALEPEGRHSGSYFVRTSYMYRPYHPNEPGESASKYDIVFKKVSQTPPEATIVLDVATTIEYVAHTDSPGWNILSASGSVTFSTSSWSLEYIRDHPAGDMYHPGHAFGSYYDYTGFRGVLRSLLEH